MNRSVHGRLIRNMNRSFVVSEEAVISVKTHEVADIAAREKKARLKPERERHIQSGPTPVRPVLALTKKGRVPRRVVRSRVNRTALAHPAIGLSRKSLRDHATRAF